MMQSLRDNMKLIIWITAIVFLVGFGILELGGVLDSGTPQGPRGIVAKVNGEPIRIDAYTQIVNQMTAQLTSQRALQEGEDSYVREQAWTQMIRAKLMEQEAKKRGIQVTPDEIKAAIRMSPPDFLMQAPVFQTDGQFDYRKYLSELDNPNSQLPWGQVEMAVANQLPMQKLQDEITLGAKVSEGDVRDRFVLLNEKLDLHYLAFRPDSFSVDTTRIGGADIENYYKSHPEEFSGPAQSKVQVLLVPRVPGESDFSAEKERLQGILDQIRAEPDSFPSFARTYSEIQSAAAGGDTPGTPYSEDMRPSFMKGLRGVQEGQVSDIIREERSLHIFRVDDRFPDKETGRERIKYHEIAVRVQPGTEAIQAARKLVGECVKEAKTSGLAAVATRRGLRTFQSEFFSEGLSGNDIFQRFPDVEAWCFAAKVGSISRPVPTENGWFVYQVLDKRKAGLRPLQSVERDVKVALIRSLRVAKAEEAAKQARAAILAGAKEEDVARQFRARAADANEVTRNGVVSGLAQEPKAVGALFTVPAGTWSPVLTGETVVFFARVLAHKAPNEEEYQRQAAQIRQNLMRERQQVAFVEWMQDLRRRAKIVDYRENFFDV